MDYWDEYYDYYHYECDYNLYEYGCDDSSEDYDYPDLTDSDEEAYEYPHASDTELDWWFSYESEYTVGECNDCLRMDGGEQNGVRKKVPLCPRCSKELNYHHKRKPWRSRKESGCSTNEGTDRNVKCTRKRQHAAKKKRKFED